VKLLLVPDPTAPNGHDGFCNALVARAEKRGHTAKLVTKGELKDELAKADAVLVNGLQPELTEVKASGRKAAWRMVEAWAGDEPRRTMAQDLAQKADMVLVPSKFLEQVVRGWGRTGPVKCVPYAYEHIMAQQVAVVTVRAVRNNGFPIVAGGPMTEASRPGLDTMFAALARLRLDWHLNLFGDGPCLEILKARAKEYVIADKVTFLGELPQSKVLEYFRSAKAFIDPCGLEGFPTQALHALSEGCPVIGARAGAVEELIADGVNGMLYPMSQPGALSEAIVTLYSVRGLSLRLIAGGIRTVEQHSWDATMGATFDALEAM
jgi:glycosyltransferase involved in cell wall biosynthesis